MIIFCAGMPEILNIDNPYRPVVEWCVAQTDNSICGCGGIGKRSERRRWREERAERVAAVGEAQACFVRRSGCRAPQQEDALDFLKE